MRLTYCSFVSESGERTAMILRAWVNVTDAAAICARLGFPTGAGDFSSVAVPDDLVELFGEHTERVLTQAKAQELFGDKWRELVTEVTAS
jgi:hypothetical protein